MSTDFQSFDASAMGAFQESPIGEARNALFNPGCPENPSPNEPCGSLVGSCYEWLCEECTLADPVLYNGLACYRVTVNNDLGGGLCEMEWEFLGCKIIDDPTCYETDMSGDTPCTEGW